MSQIIKNYSSKAAAKKAVIKIYNTDRTGGLNSGGMGFSGSVVNAIARKADSGYQLTVTSNYYIESTLNEMLSEGRD